METLDRIVGVSGKYHTECCGKYKSRFVDPTTGAVFCDECLPPGKHTVKVYKYMYNLCVSFEYIKKFLPSGSDMLTFVNNGKKIVTMKPFPRQTGEYTCLRCSNIVRAPNQYCSVSCVCKSTSRLLRKQFCPTRSPYI